MDDMPTPINVDKDTYLWFSKTANVWSSYLDRVISVKDVAKLLKFMQFCDNSEMLAYDDVTLNEILVSSEYMTEWGSM